MSLLNIFGLYKRNKQTPLEKQVLDAVSNKLGPAAKGLFDGQMNKVNLVQRHADGKEVNLYAMRGSKPVMEEELLFPVRAEAMLATVQIKSPAARKTVRAEVWAVNGRVFSIEFSKPPKALESGAEIGEVEILCDPMNPATPSEMPVPYANLPKDYLDLVKDAKGTMVNDWVICDVNAIRKLSLTDANFYVLAEKEGMGVVGAQEEEESGQLYYLNYGDDRGERITVSLRKFLEEFDGGKVEGRF